MQAHLIISGLVQGVWYRHNANKIANQLGLKGFVRNLGNGNVEVVAQGSEEKIKQLIAFCKKGPESARVDNVEVTYEPQKEEFSTFSIKY